MADGPPVTGNNASDVEARATTKAVTGLGWLFLRRPPYLVLGATVCSVSPATLLCSRDGRPAYKLDIAICKNASFGVVGCCVEKYTCRCRTNCPNANNSRDRSRGQWKLSPTILTSRRCFRRMGASSPMKTATGSSDVGQRRPVNIIHKLEERKCQYMPSCSRMLYPLIRHARSFIILFGCLQTHASKNNQSPFNISTSLML